jgi:hypothetical protein
MAEFPSMIPPLILNVPLFSIYKPPPIIAAPFKEILVISRILSVPPCIKTPPPLPFVAKLLKIVAWSLMLNVLLITTTPPPPAGPLAVALLLRIIAKPLILNIEVAPLTRTPPPVVPLFPLISPPFILNMPPASTFTPPPTADATFPVIVAPLFIVRLVPAPATLTNEELLLLRPTSVMLLSSVNVPLLTANILPFSERLILRFESAPTSVILTPFVLSVRGAMVWSA